ncbi:hypothetical protein ACFYOV_32890 [Streptomyces sp. NPDC005931]|uniref:hypothetical protein n=1 Tax=Streptomyces sp. NPDC005931 TaxID=3364737 RepID=UPI00368B6E3F
MIAEAIDTVITLGWALLAWVAVLAALGAIVILSALATGAWAVRRLWRAAGGPSWARSRWEARRLARAIRDYDEAA